MAKLRKYLFDADFGAPAGRPNHDAYGALGLTIAPPPPEPTQPPLAPPPPPPPMFSEEDLALVREQAFAAGHEAGLQEGRQQAERITADSLAAIAGQLATLDAAQRADNAARLQQSLEVAIAVVRKLHPELAKRFGTDEIGEVIQECLAQLDRDSRVTIRVHPSLLEATRERAAQASETTGFEGKLIFAGDPRIVPGDCRVEWGGGGGERDQSRIWAEIDTVLAHALGDAQGGGGTAEAAADGPDGDSGGAPV